MLLTSPPQNWGRRAASARGDSLCALAGAQLVRLSLLHSNLQSHEDNPCLASEQTISQILPRRGKPCVRSIRGQARLARLPCRARSRKVLHRRHCAYPSILSQFGSLPVQLDSNLHPLGGLHMGSRRAVHLGVPALGGSRLSEPGGMDQENRGARAFTKSAEGRRL